MPKLLQFNATANWGSTGRIAEGVGQAALDRGWESYIAYGRYVNPSQSQLIKVGSLKDVYLHYAKSKLFDGEGLGSSHSTKELIEKIKKIKPDIIHLHNIHDHWLNYPYLFEYLQTIDTPIVWTFHDCWAFTGGCAYFEIPKCDKWLTRCYNCPRRIGKIDLSKKQYNIRKQYFVSLENRLTIIPVSKWLECYCKDSMLNRSNIELIYNGIDINMFRILGKKNKKPLILGVANVWDSRKGLNDFIKIRQLIPRDYADITLVGLTDNQISQLPEGIRGIARTQNIHELVDLYNQTSVFVNPTYADNFPTTNLESLACGTPVITYNTGGSPEAVDEDTGIVVEKGDLNGLVKAIRTIIDNPGRYSIDACRKRAEQYFNKDIQFGKYIDLYETLLDKK